MGNEVVCLSREVIVEDSVPTGGPLGLVGSNRENYTRAILFPRGLFVWGVSANELKVSRSFSVAQVVSG